MVIHAEKKNCSYSNKSSAFLQAYGWPNPGNANLPWKKNYLPYTISAQLLKT
jgi:hypothetical protein